MKKIPLILCPAFAKSGTSTFGKNLLKQKHAFAVNKEPAYFARETIYYRNFDPRLGIRTNKSILRYNIFNSYNIEAFDNFFNKDVKISTEIYYEYMRELWEYAKFYYGYSYLFDGSQNNAALILREDQKENLQELFRLHEFFDVKCVIIIRHPIWRAWSLANMVSFKYGFDAYDLYDSYQAPRYEQVVTAFEKNFDTLVLSYEDLYFNRIEESHQKISKFLNVDYTKSTRWDNLGNYQSRKLSEERYNAGLIRYKDDFDFGEKYFGYNHWKK